MTNETETSFLPVKDLHFDWENPRLSEYGITSKTPDEQIIEILWEAMDVQELVQSIKASGYFPHEPLIVTKEKDKLIVIEGNRRLAAVKVLLDNRISKKNGWEIQTISEAKKKELQNLPIFLGSREDSWRYLGFKHVNGPAKWTSYAKANYIADVHRKYKTSLEDIAYQIGDRHRTVQRLYRGLMVVEQAEREKVFDREDGFQQRFYFSHMYTALDYDGFSSFLSLKPEKEESKNPVPKNKLSELGELCLWLYGSKKDNRPPVVRKQNPDLRQLNAVLNKRPSIAALRAGTDLEKAFEISRPPSAVLEEALLGAKRELTTVRAHLTTGYDGADTLLRLAGTVANMAEDIYSEMYRKHSPEEKKRMVEE